MDINKGGYNPKKYKFVDVFVENDPAVHAAFTHNPAQDSAPYNPHHDVMASLNDFKHYIMEEDNDIFEVRT